MRLFWISFAKARLALRSLAAAALLFGASHFAHAGTLLYDEFNYPPGNLVGGPGSSWTQAGAAGSGGSALIVGSTSLSYTGLARIDSGNHALNLTTNGAADGQKGELLLGSPIAGPDAYMSFLLNVSSPPPTGAAADTAVLLAFHQNTSGTAYRGAVNIYSSPNAGKYMIGVTHTSFNVGDQAGVELTAGQTYLIVIRETRVGTGTDNNDTVKLYVNPTSLNAEPASPTATHTTVSGEVDWSTTSAFDGIFAFQQHFGGAFTGQVDAIRAGTSWNDVVPPPFNNAYEEFNYASGNLIGAVGSAWTQSTAAGSTGVPLVVGGASLAYPGLPRTDTSSHSLTLQTDGTSTGAEQEGKLLFASPITGPDAYYSFLLNITTPPPINGTNDSTLIAFHESSGTNNFRGAVNLIPGTTAGTYRLGVTHFSTTFATMTSTTLNANQTYLVVVHEHRTDTSTTDTKNDVARLYINPSPIGAEPASPTVQYISSVQGSTDTDWPATANLDAMFLRARRFAGAFSGQIDAIRAGTTWDQAINGAPAPASIDPKISAPTSMSLGPIATTGNTASALIVTNAGPTKSLHILTSTTLSGAGASHFFVASGVPQTIGPNNTTGTLSISFAPGGFLGLTTATLTIASDGLNSTSTQVALKGSTALSLPIYEPFNYPAGNLTYNSNYEWLAFTSAGSTPIKVLNTAGDTSLSLTYTGMPAPMGRRVQVSGPSSTQESIERQFLNPVSSGNIYMSMLLKVTTGTLEKTGTSNDSIIAGFNKHPVSGSDATQGDLRIIQSAVAPGTPVYDLGMSLTAFTNVDVDYTATDLQMGQTYFLVIKYQIGTGGNPDTATLWINPTWAGATEGAGAAQTVVHAGRGTDVNMTATDILNGFTLQQQSFAGKYTAQVDEIRVGTSYADVTTAVNTPPPPVNATHNWQLFN